MLKPTGTASQVIGRPKFELLRAEPGSLDDLFEKMICDGNRTTDEEAVEVLEDNISPPGATYE